MIVFRQHQHSLLLLLLPLVCFGLNGCGKLDPRNVDVDLPSDVPVVKETSFDKPLAELGKMTQVYGKRVYIQGKDITDMTGLSVYGYGEIPGDITEMTKSALNAIGGNVVYIPYSPVFINNQMVTGYSNFQGKLIPDVVLSGGITEFDRGLETRGRNTDFGVTTLPFNVSQHWVPGDTISVDYNQEDQESLARITLDFNLLDFRTMSGVARMQTVNSINVYKAVADRELGFTIFGPTFGLKGTVKKVQGRHAAIRLLVQASVLQVVGRYLYLPYWKLIPDMPPDPVVLDKIRQDFRRLSQTEKVGEIQTCLYLKGYNVPVTGRLESQTQAAVAGFTAERKLDQNITDTELYVELWSSLGDNLEQVADRREVLARMMGPGTGNQAVAAAPVRTTGTKSPAKVATRKRDGAEKTEQPKAAPSRRNGNAPSAIAHKSKSSAGSTDKTAAVPRRSSADDPERDSQARLVLGNTKNSAEALINERRLAQ
ncbi:MAG: DUF4384 domain-containing protein [Desulfobulbus sp.]